MAGLAVIVVGSAPMKASAQSAEISQQLFDNEGLVTLTGNASPNGSKGRVVAWRVCEPGSSCRSLPLPEQREFLEPGEVPAGSRFELDVTSNDGRTSTDRSDVWGGRVRALTPPSVSGDVRVGGEVTPVPARWAGGWPGDSDVMRIEACPRAVGSRRCKTLSAQGEDPPTCRGGGAVIGPQFAGWWIRSVDTRTARDTVYGGVGYDRPESIPLAKPSPVAVQSRFKGPVLLTRARFAQCGTPRASIYPRLKARNGRLRVGSVTCVTGCYVEVSVTAAGLTTKSRQGPNDPRGLFVRFTRKARRARVTISVNGRRITAKTVQIVN